MSSRLLLPLPQAGAAGRAGLFGGREDLLNADLEDRERATDPLVSSSCLRSREPRVNAAFLSVVAGSAATFKVPFPKGQVVSVSS